jgi:hypothetical protein
MTQLDPAPTTLRLHVPDAQFPVVADVLGVAIDERDAHWSLALCEDGASWLLTIDDTVPDLAAHLPHLQPWDAGVHPHPVDDSYGVEDYPYLEHDSADAVALTGGEPAEGLASDHRQPSVAPITWNDDVDWEEPFWETSATASHDSPANRGPGAGGTVDRAGPDPWRAPAAHPAPGTAAVSTEPVDRDEPPAGRASEDEGSALRAALRQEPVPAPRADDQAVAPDIAGPGTDEGVAAGVRRAQRALRGAEDAIRRIDEVTAEHEGADAARDARITRWVGADRAAGAEQDTTREQEAVQP